MAKRFYPAVLEKGAKGAFAAWFPDIPDCVAAGPTQEEAIERAEHELARYVDQFAEQERPLPEATPFEKIALPKGTRLVAFFAVGVEPPDPSERVNIYLSKSLIARADKRAAELGMSRSSFFGFAVSMLIGWDFGSSPSAGGRPRLKATKSVALPGTKRPGAMPGSK